MIFAKKKKNLVWCDDPPEDPVISIFPGCLANHDRAHSHDITHTRHSSFRASFEGSGRSQCIIHDWMFADILDAYKYFTKTPESF